MIKVSDEQHTQPYTLYWEKYKSKKFELKNDASKTFYFVKNLYHTTLVGLKFSASGGKFF